MQSRAVKRIRDVRILRGRQFPEDSGPMSHPIRPDKYVEINNFYTMTVYQKGAEIIRMYHTLLGEEGFQKGMQLYFQRHDHEAVTCDDFRAAMADANGVNLDRFGRWYGQSGTPEVTARGEYDSSAKSFVLTVSQRTPPTLGQPDKVPLVIPLAWAVMSVNGMTEAGDMHILYSSVSCVLAGAVWGDHCSPISDTTVLSSIASGCNHIEHVRTQLPYALLVGLVAIVIGTVPGGYGVPPWVSLLVGGVILYVVLRLRGRQADVDAAG